MPASLRDVNRAFARVMLSEAETSHPQFASLNERSVLRPSDGKTVRNKGSSSPPLIGLPKSACHFLGRGAPPQISICRPLVKLSASDVGRRDEREGFYPHQMRLRILRGKVYLRFFGFNNVFSINFRRNNKIVLTDRIKTFIIESS